MVRDRNPFVTRIVSKKHLRNSDFHSHALEYRTAKLLERCATNIRNKRKGGIFNAWNDTVPMMVQLGRAYVEQLTFEEFLKVVEAQHDREIKSVLKLLLDLFALNCIQRDIGNFMELIKKNKARAIGTLVQGLCQQVRHHAVSLVDAFEIPDFIIDAPIGLSKGYYVNHILDYAKENNPRNHSFSVSGDKKPTLDKQVESDDNDEFEHDIMEYQDKK
jgi:acyl-CoA oxidase